jgi:hypothetical protein
MGQGDQPPAKKCKWSWSAEDTASPVRNKCLSEIGYRKTMPQLIIRRRSSEDFFQRNEVITDELPDLDVDCGQKKSSPQKLSPSHKHKHRTHSHTADKQLTKCKSEHSTSGKHRTESLDSDASKHKHRNSSKDVKKHRHKSEQHHKNHKHRISYESTEKHLSSPDRKHHQSEHNHHHHHHHHHQHDGHKKHSHSSHHEHKTKDKSSRHIKELEVHICKHGSDCDGSSCMACRGAKHDKKEISRNPDSPKKEKFLKDNVFGIKCRGCLSPRVLLSGHDDIDLHVSGGNYGKKLLSEFLHTGGKKEENEILCAQIDTSTEIEYERDTDRDSCDGRGDNVSSTNTNLGSASLNMNLKFSISAEQKQRFSSVLRRSVSVIASSEASSSSSDVDSKRVRRVSADTSSHLIKSLQSCDSASDCGSVSSNATRHFLDALSDIQDDCESANDENENSENEVSVRCKSPSHSRTLTCSESIEGSDGGKTSMATAVVDALEVSKDIPEVETEQPESVCIPETEVSEKILLNSESPMSVSNPLFKTCAVKTEFPMSVSAVVFIQENAAPDVKDSSLGLVMLKTESGSRCTSKSAAEDACAQKEEVSCALLHNAEHAE